MGRKKVCAEFWSEILLENDYLEIEEEMRRWEVDGTSLESYGKGDINVSRVVASGSAT
jgi:hypothetical protein